jgi:CRP-like cAMP-binding protein
MMPELDGFGVLHILRKDPKFQDIPFIFLTAKSERADYRKSMDLGADDFLSKPFALMALLTSIEARLDKAVAKSVTQIFSKEITENDKAAWVQKLFSISQVKRFSVNRKTNIIQEGSIAHQLVLVERGIVKAYSKHPCGKILITDTYFKGDIIGLSDLIGNKTFSISAESVSDAELAVIPVEDLKEYMSRHLKEAEFIAHFVCLELIQKQAKLVDMAYTPMRERVENLMKSLNKKLEANHLDDITDYFTREELAQMAGTATESLIRVLGGKQ